MSSLKEVIAFLSDYAGDCDSEGLQNEADMLREAAAALEREQLPTTGYYLQDSRQFVGNDMLWWATDGSGYTTDLRKAHIYPDTAKPGLRDTDVFWPVAYINSLSRPVVDHQYAKRKDAAAHVRAITESESAGEAGAAGAAEPERKGRE